MGVTRAELLFGVAGVLAGSAAGVGVGYGIVGHQSARREHARKNHYLTSGDLERIVQIERAQEWVKKVRSKEYPEVAIGRHQRSEIWLDALGVELDRLYPPATRQGLFTFGPSMENELYFEKWRFKNFETGREFRQTYPERYITTIFRNETFHELTNFSPHPHPAGAIGRFVPHNELSSALTSTRTDVEGVISALMPIKEGSRMRAGVAIPRERFVFGFSRHRNNEVWVEEGLTAFYVSVKGDEYIFASLTTYNPKKKPPLSDQSRPVYDGFAVVITDRDGRVLQTALSYQEHWGGSNRFGVGPVILPPPRAG